MDQSKCQSHLTTEFTTFPAAEKSRPEKYSMQVLESLEPAQGKETTTALNFKSVHTVQQLPAHQHICTSHFHHRGVASQLAAKWWAGGTKPLHETQEDSQTPRASRDREDIGRHSLITSVVSGKGTAAEDVQRHSPLVSLDPTTYETCSWALRKQHYSSHRI